MIRTERKSACITGATSGIGAAFASRFAREGYDLILTGRRKERIASLADTLSKESPFHLEEFTIHETMLRVLSPFSYQLGVSMGTQEPAGRITEVGAAFWYGFAFGDLIIYVPLMAAGLIGHLRSTCWGIVTLAAALGMMEYRRLKACVPELLAPTDS